jgi:hypothetical protein
MESGYAEAIYMEKTDNIWNRRDNPSSTIIWWVPWKGVQFSSRAGIQFIIHSCAQIIEKGGSPRKHFICRIVVSSRIQNTYINPIQVLLWQSSRVYFDPKVFFAWFGKAISLTTGPFEKPRGKHLKDMAFDKSVGLDRMKISVCQNNLHTRQSGYFIRQKNKSYTIHHVM